MTRRGKTRKVYVGAKVETMIAAKLQELATNNGVSVNEALRRLIVQAILANRVPGITSGLDLEQREAEKWGEAATPTYTGESEPKKHSEGRLTPAPHAE